MQDTEEFAVENEDIFMQINNLSLSDESSEAKEDSSNKDENDAIITNLGKRLGYRSVPCNPSYWEAGL